MILDHCEPELNTGCMLWSKGCVSGGYGSTGPKKKRAYTHRRSYEENKGPIPDGLWVLHKCDTPACCNPAHLFLGDQKANMSDASRKGRVRNQLMGKTHCKRGHPLSGDNLYVWARSGCRQCKACARIRAQIRKRIR